MSDQQAFPCSGCGADLEFEVGTTDLKCPYCGAANSIGTSSSQVVELDYSSHLSLAARDAATVDVITVHCDNCGANPTLDAGVTADRCPFCATPVVAQGKSSKIIRPQALAPFKVKRDDAIAAFNEWIGSLWFAPTALLPAHIADGMSGVYLPYWTYDSVTTATYRGERGEHYMVTEMVTETDAEGNEFDVEKEVQHTRWYPASGRVTLTFDDILIHATDALPSDSVQALEPWDLEALVDFDNRFLAGFRAESAGVPLAVGFERAVERMKPKLEDAIEDDIGGDEQRIDHFDPHHRDVTFKHVLLPIWISAFRFNDKVFRVVVNGRTGEVQGERPYSRWKIATFIMLIIAEIALLVYYWPAAIALLVIWLGVFFWRRR